MKRVRQIFALAALFAATTPLPAVTDAALLPPADTVLKRVNEQSAKEDENERTFQERYAFSRTKVTEYRNSKGEVKKREEKTSENRPQPRADIADAAPPRPATRSPKQSQINAPPSDTNSNLRGRAFEKSDFILNSEVLTRFDFAVTGREIVNGRPTLLVDFKPANKKLPVRNFKDRFINKAAGRVWVDEADYVLVKADLYLTERVNVVGGLVGAVWKFTYGFLRDRTPDGLWFTRTADWHLEGRELFVNRTVDYHEERKDVRPAMNVTSR